ncbi:MAG: PAS domain S-box protein [Methanoregula sp.]|jgi:PAS domain S-box-containing protein|nr:PAS domain S-box protein [Methanoregula sp.]
MVTLKQEIEELREKNRELEETLNAIRSGEVDAIVVTKGTTRQIYTREGADLPYRTLIENIREGALTLSRTGMILFTNTRFADMIGISPDKLPGTSILDHVCSEYHSDIEEGLSEIVRKPCRIHILIKQRDSSLPVLISMNPLSSDEDTKISVVVADRRIDEDRIQMQAKILDAVGDAVIAVDTDYKIIFWNDAAIRTYGWKPEEVIGRNIVDVIVPELSKNDAQKIPAQLEREESSSKECIMRHQDGHKFPVRVIDSNLFDDAGNIIAIISVSHDISQQKLADDALRINEETLLQAQELLDAVTKGTDVIMAAQDVNFCYTFFNQAYKEEITRITGKDLTLGASMVELFAEIPEEQKNTIKEWSKVLQGNNVNQRIEFSHPNKNSRVYQVLHTPLRNMQGNIVGAGEVAFDVSKQVQVEEALRETKEYLDNIISYANAPIIVWDPQFRITLFNRAFEHLTGRKAKEVIGKQFDILLPERYLIPSMDLIKKTLEGERWDSVEIPILHNDGGIRTVLWNSAAIFGPDGKTIVSTIAQGQDISDRKKIESEYRQRAEEYAKMNVALEQEIRQRKLSDTTLKKTLSLLNASLESTADGILVVDLHGRITSYNQNFMNMWSIPRDLLELRENEKVINHVLSQLKNSEDFLASTNELKVHPARESFDMIEFIDGKIFERYSKPQIIGDKVVGRVWSYRDITDRKRAEEKLVASIKEKEVLLREIHHRVKNNLQLISGLLDMTRMRTEDESTNSILTDMMLKIQTMAQIHTRLYESKQFGRINISGQFRDQVAALSNIYSHKGHEIRCEIQSQEIFIPVDQAIPCALVINEILSNAFKHAFKGRIQGVIEISAMQENEKIRIRVSDDGIGMPDNFDICRSNSLGLKLIRTLVQHQLRGSLMINSHQGTEIIVEFPIMIAGT